VDDGAATIADSVAIARAAAEDGVRVLAATPHVRADYPTAPETMEQLVAQLNAASPGVEVLPGGELDRAQAAELDDETLRRFGLGGNPGVLLLETPYVGWPLDLGELVFRLRTRGFDIVLAHPERNPEVQLNPERLRALVDAGVLVQLTAASVDGRLGRHSAACARTLLDGGLAHMIASDAHAPAVRAAGMTSAADAIGDERLARWLTHDVPAALVAGEPPPPRPRKRFRLLRR